MIITEQKSIEEIEEKIEPYKKIVIIGCAECAAITQTGGSEQVKEMAEHLEEDLDKKVLATLMIDSPCDERITRRDIKLIQDELEEAEILLLMTCGLGCQSIGRITGVKYIPALNTLSMGRVERLGIYPEDCIGCDDCVLFEYDGKCPYLARKVCKDCNRILRYDSKYCDICGSQNLETGEAKVYTNK
ncbi:MAG: hypothetical protein GF329_13055 [Candidatus Lokiarchaeota archaeon]|nr:hypothetical protein [Candidatus Lokiarchaeota archaeon]